MGEPARKRHEGERQGGQQGDQQSLGQKVPTLSLSELKDSVQGQPLDEKLYTWSCIVFVAASILPWTEAGANGWSSSGVRLVSAAMLLGLVLHVLGLQRIGPARPVKRRGYYKLFRWVFALQAVIFAIYVAIRIPYLGKWGVGLLLCCMAFGVQLLALYRIFEREGLLPLRIER